MTWWNTCIDIPDMLGYASDMVEDLRGVLSLLWRVIHESEALLIQNILPMLSYDKSRSTHVCTEEKTLDALVGKKDQKVVKWDKGFHIYKFDSSLCFENDWLIIVMCILI